MYDNPYMAQYNPYMRQQNSTQMPMQQIIRVTGLEGAKAYQIGANSSIALFDENSDIFYVKTTDMGGFPTIRTFKFEPVVESAPIPQGNYVTREEFDELKGMILNGEQPVRKQGKQSAKSAGTTDADA